MSDERPKRIEFTVSDDLWDRINEARGFEPRASFVKRALESALGEGPHAGAAPVDRGEGSRTAQAASASSVSSRAPDEPVAKVLGAAVRKSRKTPSLKDTWGR